MSTDIKQTAIVRARELFPSRRYPENRRDKHHQSRSRAGIILYEVSNVSYVHFIRRRSYHVLAVHRTDSGQVRDDADEKQVDKANDVEDNAPATK